MKFPMCTLSDIINPGTYVVVTTDKEHLAEVKNLEECMTKELLHVDTSNLQLEPKMCVAVKGVSGNLARGVIEKKTGKDFYEVLLMDYGQVVEVKKSRIIVITNQDFIKVEPLAFMVKLYGLIPARYCVGDGKAPKACKEWGQDSQEFVNTFFKEDSKIVVQSILIQQRTVYGDLFIKDKSKMKFVSLRKLLCKNKFCAYSETAFLRHENLSIPSESVEMETKMEMVEKWQKENFGQFKQETYKLPSAVHSPHSSVSDVTSLNVSDIQTSDRGRGQSGEEESNSAFTEKAKGIGMGRGKLKLMIAEMRSKEQDAAETFCPGPRQSESRSEGEVSRTSRGRGSYLKKVLATMKSASGEAESCRAGSSSEECEGSRKVSGTFSKVEKTSAGSRGSGSGSGSGKFESVSKVEKAVVKPGEFLELSDSNGLTEVSLSTEDDPPPPLTRMGSVKSSLESSEMSGGETVSRCEIEECGEMSKSRAKLELDCESKEGSYAEREKIDLECSKLRECRSWCCETNSQVRERPSSLIASNSCWTPFVLFDDSVVESISNFRELPIQPSIIKNLERRGPFKSLSQVQRWAIPAIRKQHNTVLVSGPKTGKTLSYIVPLVDYVQDESYFEELPRGNGPSVVILASSAAVCESIYYMCHHLLGHLHQKHVATSKIKLVLAHGNGCEEETWVSLTNGCDILVSTPPCLVRLLEFPVLTNFERLSCLVVDEVDVVCDNPFRKQVRIIFEKAHLSTRDRHYQKILCGERWTPHVETIVKTYVKSYALVMGSYSEAVIYKRLKPAIFLVDKSRKAELLVDKLGHRMKHSKVLIFCEATAEAVLVAEFLTEKGIAPLVAHEKILAEKLREIGQAWKNSTPSVLVITDGVLADLNVKHAHVLVHYDLPYKSKTNFFLRYSTVLSSCPERTAFQKTEGRGRPEDVHTFIFIDDHDHHQLPHIAEFVARLGEKMPQTVVERCEDIRRMKEVGKSGSPVCGNLLSFGCCRDSRTCPRRHALVKAWDSPGDLPASGWLNFEVVKTHDASLFSARLLEHVDDEGNSRRLDCRGADVRERVGEYLRDENNRRPLGSPKVGSVCGVKSDGAEEEEGEKETFHRAKVIEYLKMDKHDVAVEVAVKLLDAGDVWKRKSVELYELPEELSTLPPTAVDVRVVGVQPKDFDVAWSQVANRFVSRLLTRRLEPNQYWSGKIALALNNTLFLDPIKRKQFLPHLNLHVFDLTLREELFNHGVAVANSEHLRPLLKLSREAGMEVAQDREKKKTRAAKVQPQWAFFDSDVAEVRFSAAENTSVVFLQQKKHLKVLEALEADCQEEGEKTAAEMKALRAKKPDAVVGALAAGDFCLARFEDGKWNRGRIESESESDAFVFFVDHGDFLSVSKEDVVPISERLLLRLPCQAIECRLVGVEDEEECPLEVLQEMYAFSGDGKEDLYARVVRKEAEPRITRGRRYDVVLSDRKGVSLNRVLVDGKMVVGRESERCDLERLEEEEEEGEGEEEAKGGEYLLDDLTNLKDDVFEDEDGLEFLKEFASKLFPTLEGFQEIPESGKEEEEDARRKAAARTSKLTPAKQRFQRALELQKKRQTAEENSVKLRSRQVLTPQVLWHQTQAEVRLKILLGNVRDYSLECTHSNLSFRCLQGEKLYAVDLRLFGGVNPRMTKVRTKAFHVSVALTKLAYPLWPRLPLDEGRHRWISVDAEGLEDEEGPFAEKIKAAKTEIGSGLLKEGMRGEEVQACSDLEDSDGECDSDTDDSDDVI